MLSFDAEEQQLFFSAMRLADSTPFALLIRVALVALALVAVYAAWMRWSTRSRVDRVRALYDRFCETAARFGVRRSPAEGPRDFSARAAQAVPGESERIQRITDAYIALRYAGGESAGAAVDELAAEVTAFGRSRAK